MKVKNRREKPKN